MGPDDLADPKPLQLSQLKAEAFKFCVVTKRLGQSKANYVAALQDAWAIAASTASALAEPGPAKQISAGQRLATAAIAEEAEEAVTPEGAGTEVMSVPAPGSSTAYISQHHGIYRRVTTGFQLTALPVGGYWGQGGRFGYVLVCLEAGVVLYAAVKIAHEGRLMAKRSTRSEDGDGEAEEERAYLQDPFRVVALVQLLLMVVIIAVRARMMMSELLQVLHA